VTDTPVEADRIERNLEATRARLDATLDALQQKLSPGEMVDQAVTYIKEGSGAEFGRNLLVSVRENPIPAVLVGVGIAWLMMTSPRDRARSVRDEREGLDTWLEERERYGDRPYAPEPAAGTAFAAPSSEPAQYAEPAPYAGTASGPRSSDP
jgi:hypothetical protein